MAILVQPSRTEPTLTQPSSTPPLRVLMMSYEFPPIGGGGARVVYGLSRALVELGHEVDLITMRFGGLPAIEEVDGVRVHRVPCVRLSEAICSPPEMLSYVLSATPYALRLARTRRFDINHTHFIFPDGLISCVLQRRLGLPYVVTTHGSDVPGYNPDRFKLYHRLLAPVWQRVVGGAAQLVCPSESLHELVRLQRDRVPVTLVPNGFRPTRFDASRPKGERVLLVTRMFQRKGVQYLLEALRDVDLGWSVDIVGDGPYLPELRRRAEGLRTPVTFHGWIDNGDPRLREMYEQARIVVYPSEAENFPIALLEGMAAGAAIITTRGTGCAEVVGDTGVLVSPRSPDEIRSALLALVADPERCATLGAAARARIDSEFTWPVVARRYERVFHAHAKPAGAAGSGAPRSLAARG
jgi:glycosyltransferase involved in cell wall biosynthesis